MSDKVVADHAKFDDGKSDREKPGSDKQSSDKQSSDKPDSASQPTHDPIALMKEGSQTGLWGAVRGAIAGIEDGLHQVVLAGEGVLSGALLKPLNALDQIVEGSD